MPRTSRNPLTKNVIRYFHSCLSTKKIKRKDFAKKLNVKISSFNSWFQLDNTVPVKHLVNVCKHLNDDTFTELCINEVEKIIASDRPNYTKYNYKFIIKDLNEIRDKENKTKKIDNFNGEERSVIQKMIWEINTMRTYHELWGSLSPRQVTEIIGHMEHVVKFLEMDTTLGVMQFENNEDLKHSIYKFISFMRWIKNNSYHAEQK